MFSKCFQFIIFKPIIFPSLTKFTCRMSRPIGYIIINGHSVPIWSGEIETRNFQTQFELDTPQRALINSVWNATTFDSEEQKSNTFNALDNLCFYLQSIREKPVSKYISY